MYIYALIAFAILALLWYQRRKHHMSLFQRFNIPGPQPHFFTGNLKEVQKKGVAECESQWTKKYGKILGYYLGARPILMVTDTELIKYVEVKNFQDFLDRPVFLVTSSIPDHRIFQGISVMKGDARWKEIRSLLSPGFTTNKMKQMTEHINKATKVLLEIIKDKIMKKEALDLETVISSLTMDIIERTVFGLKSDIQLNANSLYQRSVREVKDTGLFSCFASVMLCLPELEPIFDFVAHLVDRLKAFLGLPSAAYVFEYLKEVIMMRRAAKTTRPDLLQVMIDANMSENQMKAITGKQLTASLDNDYEDIVMEAKSSPKAHSMTDDEVIANAIILMLAGHDTTSITLRFVLHLLARHPDVQEKLREEVNSALEGEEPDYNAISKMNYMQQVISETLRLYPIVLTFIFRAVRKSFTYKNFRIPEGVTIQPALWPLHRDPELWKEPTKFDPDRFSHNRKSEINTYAYQPFGLGPRNCIGMRFAYTVMKLVLANLLRSFKFVEEGECKEEEMKLEYQLFVFKPAGDIRIKAVAV